MATLDTAVRQLSATRAAVLTAVDQVQKGATAVDAADAACTTGQGVAARTVYRSGEAATQQARAALAVLPRRLATYKTSLTRLVQASRTLDGAPRNALGDVVRAGEAEAAAVARFTVEATRAWVQYEASTVDVQTWITRAVTPWYRDATEGAAAYAVLVGDTRSALEAARGSLGAASDAVRLPVQVQAGTLRRADQVLAGLRGKS